MQTESIDDGPSFEQRFEAYCFKHLCREINEAATARGDEALFVPGFERALVGYVETGSRVRTLYGINACIEILMEREGLSSKEAEDTFFCKTIHAYMGEAAPVFAVIHKSLLKTPWKIVSEARAAIIRQEESPKDVRS